MDEEESFIRALRADPGDRVARLVYADWLDERADPRGEYLRLADSLMPLLGDPAPPPQRGRMAELRPHISPDWLAQVGSHRRLSDHGRDIPDARPAQVADRLGRPVTFTDPQGYECEITAASEHPTSGAVAYIECRSQWRGQAQDITYTLHLRQADGQTVAWEPHTYNPFFGCDVRFLEWYGSAVVVIYREKHQTYAARVGIDGGAEYKAVADDWVLAGPQLAHRGWREPEVKRLTIPGLEELPALTEQQAIGWDLLPPKRW